MKNVKLTDHEIEIISKLLNMAGSDYWQQDTFPECFENSDEANDLTERLCEKIDSL